jgi:hypothetical protein
MRVTRPRKAKSLALTLAIVLLLSLISGCANPFEDHYKSLVTSPNDGRSVSRGASCGVIETGDTAVAARERRSLESRGYKLIGTASFEGRALSDASTLAKKQGERVGAEIIVLLDTFKSEKIEHMLIEYPQTLEEERRCAYSPERDVRTLFGTRVQGRCARRISETPIRIEIRRYDVTYWARVYPQEPVDCKRAWQ